MLRRMERVSVSRAAGILGTTDGAIRKRIARGTLRHERDGEGRVWVLLPGDGRGDDGQDAGHPAGRGLEDELRDRISYLERQVEEEREARRRADIMLSRLMDRLPELESAQAAPQEPAEGPQRVPEGQDASETQAGRQEADQGPQKRPWWRRIFGG